MKRISLHKVMAKLADEPKRVQLAAMQDADALYDKIVRGAQAQASILNKVENELKSLAADAKEMQKMEQRLESMAKELGVDLDINYAADTWVETLTENANKVGLIANIL
jgi:aspartate/tyrosine/aromatic aminotransferase